MNDNEFFWLVGLLEGEGSFLKGPPSRPHYPGISFQTTDEDVVQRVAQIFGTTYHKTPNTRNKKWKQAFAVLKRGSGAIELMQKLRPHMGFRRKQQIDAAINCYKVLPHRGGSQLDIEIVKKVRSMDSQGFTNKNISQSLNLEASTVSRIKLRRTYADVPDDV